MSLVEDLGQDKKTENGNDKVDKANGEEEKYDKLELRNRTVTETMSLVADLGQDLEEKEPAEKEERDKFDKLELRNRTVTETMSLVSDFGQREEESEEPETK